MARIGDAGSHGGSIVSGSPTGTADGEAIARVGDIYACPIHGGNPIADGSPSYTLDGKAVARVGDPTACGAVIVSGSPSHRDDS
ncbi:PAAR domain-containing protein [Afifella sp. H1R]|uniref:PAAR domain-containing protein n=1 Tax=Afifella sp. H1R TaxID=2908841 RepID=UPI001F45E906|nr:PAAR domain-containing protein [Afifella sp. H1R]